MWFASYSFCECMLKILGDKNKMFVHISSNFIQFQWWSDGMCCSLEWRTNFPSRDWLIVWMCCLKTRQFFTLSFVYLLFVSHNVNEFYSFIITINDDHQHRIRIRVYACSQCQLNMIRNKYDARHKVPISYMWNDGEHQNSNNNHTRVYTYERSEVKKMYMN